MFQEEMAQRTIIVRLRRRMLMWRLRLRDRISVMMVMLAASVLMLAASVLMLDRLRALRALLVNMSRRMLVRVDDGGRGRD